MKDGNKCESTNYSIGFRNLSTLLQGDEDGVLCELLKKKKRKKYEEREKRGAMTGCYLLVELVNAVRDLVLGLDEDWVLLDSLSCGHNGWCKRGEWEEKGSNAMMTRVCSG